MNVTLKKSLTKETYDIIKKSFIYFELGLIMTAIFPIYIYLTKDLSFLKIIEKNIFGIIISQLVLTIIISSIYNKVNYTISRILYFAFTCLTGLGISTLVIIYPIGYVLYALISSAILFLIMALYGIIAKEDMSKYSSLTFGSLITILIISVVNLLIKSSLIEYLISVASVIVFSILIAYDINKLKELSKKSGDKNALALIGAFKLYLDFINLFLNILRFIGNPTTSIKK